MSREQDINYTEKEVEKKIGSIISSSKGLVFVEFSMSNIDRFMSVYRSTVANKRKMVIDTKFAYILDNLREKLPVIPDVMTDKNILVYYRMAKSCTYDEKDYYIWERKFFPKMITHKDVSSKQKEYVMHMGFYKLMELVYIQPKNAQYIYSSSEHFLEGEDNKDQRRVMENWMGHFGIRMHKAHCSGHASRDDLSELIKEINPKELVPVHTVSADDFKELHKNVKAPVKFEKMEL
jgi:ribonuclease J